MRAVLDRVRNLLGFSNIVTSKRDRSHEEDDYSDDELPSVKRAKAVSSTRFPRHMSDHNEREPPHRSPPNVRIVPIQVEGRPSTSTPNEGRWRQHQRPRRAEEVEVRQQRPRAFASRDAVHSVDDDPDISWIEPKPNFTKSNRSGVSETFVLLDDEDEVEEQDENADVVYVKRVLRPQCVHRRDRELTPDRNSPKLLRLYRNYPERRDSSPKPKFKSPAGVTKTYRPKVDPSIPKWVNPIRTSTLSHIPLRNRLSQMNNNVRTAIKEAFNLEEKRSYRELIQQISQCTKPTPSPKPIEVIDLADEYSSFRETQRTQKLTIDRLKSTPLRTSVADNDQDKDSELIMAAALNSSDSEVEIVPDSSNASTTSSVRIQPINSLKTSQKDCSLLGRSWLDSITNKYRKKQQEKTAKSCDIARESNLIGEINREQSIAQLQRNLKHDLKLTDTAELEEEPVVEIPQLTPEQDKLVERMLGSGPGGYVAIEKFGLSIHRRDLQTLAGLNWLNDEVINFYMNLITQRSQERKDLPRVYTANTFFYPKLIQSGQAGLRRWTRKVDIFAHQLMVIPVHLGVHWCLCLVELDKKRVLYLDSMGGPNQRCLDAVLQYLRDEHKDKKGQPFDDSGWRKEHLKDIPQQMNGSDCGMFACTFAEFASRRAAFTFTQSDMPNLRRKVAYEILQGKLMQ